MGHLGQLGRGKKNTKYQKVQQGLLETWAESAVLTQLYIYLTAYKHYKTAGLQKEKKKERKILLTFKLLHSTYSGFCLCTRVVKIKKSNMGAPEWLVEKNLPYHPEIES